MGGGEQVDATEAAVTLGAVVLGAAISQIGSWLGDLRRERRAERAERKASLLDQLRQTRRLAVALVDLNQALARGDLEASAAATKRMEELEEADLQLIGDDGVALEYRELLIRLNNRFGLGLSVEDMIRTVEVQGRVSSALTRQEDKARRTKPLTELSEGTRAQLADARGMAERLIAIGQAPTVPGRAARLLIYL